MMKISKKSSRKNKNWLIVVALVVVLWFFWAKPLGGGCAEGDNYVSCEGASAVRYFCENNAFKKQNVTKCGATETCFSGVCVQRECSQDKKVCSSDYSYIYQKCSNGIYENEEKLCGKGTYCVDGNCISQPSSCGDYICQDNENFQNCYSDCGKLSSWEEYYKLARSVPDYEKYTECTPIFNCGNSEIHDLSEKIMWDYNARTPKAYIDAVVDYVYKTMPYDLAGGYSQTGESATDILHHYEQYGTNCVDYSVLMIALCRQKGVLIRQRYGCVKVGWQCRPFAFVVPEFQRLGYITATQPMGHSWVSIWTPDLGWVDGDPTVGKTTSKCVEYYGVGFQAFEPAYYVPTYAQVCFA